MQATQTEDTKECYIPWKTRLNVLISRLATRTRKQKEEMVFEASKLDR